MRQFKVGDRVRVLQLVPTLVYPIGVVIEIRPGDADQQEEYVVEFAPNWSETFLAIQLQWTD